MRAGGAEPVGEKTDPMLGSVMVRDKDTKPVCSTFSSSLGRGPGWVSLRAMEGWLVSVATNPSSPAKEGCRVRSGERGRGLLARWWMWCCCCTEKEGLVTVETGKDADVLGE